MHLISREMNEAIKDLLSNKSGKTKYVNFHICEIKSEHKAVRARARARVCAVLLLSDRENMRRDNHVIPSPLRSALMLRSRRITCQGADDATGWIECPSAPFVHADRRCLRDL